MQEIGNSRLVNEQAFRPVLSENAVSVVFENENKTRTKMYWPFVYKY